MTITLDGTTGITSPNDTTGNQSYTGTLTGGTGVVNLGSGQFYKDASGNVGIGTSSPSKKLAVSNAGATGIEFDPTVSSTEAETLYYNRNTSLYVNNRQTALEHRFLSGTSPTERMRIDSSGNLLVGTTTPLNTSYRLSVTGSAGGAWFQGSNAGDATVVAESKGAAWNFYGINDAAVNTFYVLKNGDVRNTNNSYGAISDAKLKENIVDATPKLEDLLKVKIRHYNLIGDSSKQIGVVAQELEQVFPKLVETNVGMTTELEPNPEPTKSVKYSVFVPMLIKAIQEQQTMIETLTTRLTALEGK